MVIAAPGPGVGRLVAPLPPGTNLLWVAVFVVAVIVVSWAVFRAAARNAKIEEDAEQLHREVREFLRLL